MPMTVYVAWDGGVDGRDRSIIGHYETRRMAEEAAKGRGVFGHGDGDVSEIKVETERDRAEEKRLKALAKAAARKLTPEELDAVKRCAVEL